MKEKAFLFFTAFGFVMVSFFCALSSSYADAGNVIL
jgi:hypothetical protein